MRVHVDDFEKLHDFAVGVMARAGKEANRAIFLTIVGGIVWRVHPGSIEIRFRDDNLANVVLRWMSITGNEYACVYNPQLAQIEIHDRIDRGSVLYALALETPIVEVERIFATL